jgi:hypothetical protein
MTMPMACAPAAGSDRAAMMDPTSQNNARGGDAYGFNAVCWRGMFAMRSGAMPCGKKPRYFPSVSAA